MEKLLTILLLIFPMTAWANNYENYISKAMKTAQTEHVYKVIPWLDLANQSSNGDIQSHAISAKLEFMIMKSNGKLVADVIDLCKELKIGNQLGGFSIGGGSSKELEPIICSLTKTTSGKALFKLGLKIMERTNVDISGMNHALPYFELAEKKGYYKIGLYKARGLIYYANGKYKLAESDLGKYITKKQDPLILRFFGLSQLHLAKTKTQLKVGLESLDKAYSLGDKGAKEIIDIFNGSIPLIDSGLKREKWADSELNDNHHTFGYSCNGSAMTVAQSGNFISTWGLSGCLLSTTTHTHSVASAAKESCACYMAK